MIYDLRCPSASLFSPLDSSDRVFLGGRILVSVLLGIECCACMIFMGLLLLVPAVILIACRLRLMFCLSCRFDICLERNNLFLARLDVCLDGLQL
jgi:hypothetical protein